MISAIFFSFVIRLMVLVSATSTLAMADSDGQLRLVFDLNSLIWALIGALGWGLISYLLKRRIFHRNDVRLVKPVAVKPVVNSGEEESGASESGKKNENFSEYLTPLDETTTVTVEELSNVVEQVDLFLLLGRYEVAVGILLARIGEEDRNDPRTWFKLLDVYHASGNRASFEKLANDIRGRFNVALPTWEDSTVQAEGRHGLEHFPHLLEKISDCWGSSSSLSYLQSLVKDNRSGARTGFNEDAFREVMFLISILEQARD